MSAASPKPLALVGARLVDPETEREFEGGVLVRDGRIAAVGVDVTRETLAADVTAIDCRGLIVAPGLIDMRAFVGEPGLEHRETIASASAAAAAGGVTTIVATAEAAPVVDEPAVVDFLLRRARDTGRVRILPVAALTRGRHGVELAEIGLLKEAGAVAFSDGPVSVANAQVMRRALTYARDFDALIMHHCEDPDLARGGVMNEGEFASRLGLTGIPCEAESIMLARDLRLVALTGGRYHASIVSCRQSLGLIADAKARGLRVTCGTTINHLTLNENDIGGYRTFLRLSPPLRDEEERLALVEAVADGLIDVVVSDHNPQDVETKRLPFGEAEPGAIGLETLLSAGLRLVYAETITLPRLIASMTIAPARILCLPQGRLAPGAPADLVAFDPDEAYVVDSDNLHSRCRNTPFDEARMQGRVKTTIVGGAVVHAA
jgi:dihydroorotase